MLFNKDMKTSEVEKLVGTNIYEKMMKIMKGQTRELKEGKIYFYSYDLQKAYDIVCEGDEK